ncbi:ABC transporter ATP-binding protein [Kitasatospora sp. NPDC058190]|uniref:ABC transporter ATP-binding protein n=1 Tax=Kitasatospora sp. NPDC058190 TaxID=3346371 RepID=UPI0036DA6ECC
MHTDREPARTAPIDAEGLLVGASSLISAATPFLLKETLDVAVPQGRTGLLSLLALGMIAATVLTSVVGVWQTLISTTVGQRVMHDLRSAVFGRLQRMSLAFFTRTRSGEVQSRIANDIGGMQATVTSTATALVANLTSVVATLVAMVALDWRLTLDGVDVRDLDFDTLARAVGVVSQETYLFHASVADNLRFAKPDATDEELHAAARAAQIHDHIAALPEVCDTIVGERGHRFSGGEKQRLAIARTILRDPPVLILDEATSALDTRTEAAVQDAVDALSADRTTLTIAHRMSTVRGADQILALDAGHVTERGTHGELLEQGGRYAALVHRDAQLQPTN